MTGRGAERWYRARTRRKCEAKDSPSRRGDPRRCERRRVWTRFYPSLERMVLLAGTVAVRPFVGWIFSHFYAPRTFTGRYFQRNLFIALYSVRVSVSPAHQEGSAKSAGIFNEPTRGVGEFVLTKTPIATSFSFFRDWFAAANLIESWPLVAVGLGTRETRFGL